MAAYSVRRVVLWRPEIMTYGMIHPPGNKVLHLQSPEGHLRGVTQLSTKKKLGEVLQEMVQTSDLDTVKLHLTSEVIRTPWGSTLR